MFFFYPFWLLFQYNSYYSFKSNQCLLCILTSRLVLHMLWAGQNHFYIFSHQNKERRRRKHMKTNKKLHLNAYKPPLKLNLTFFIFLVCLPAGFLPVLGLTERWCCLRHFARPCYVALGQDLICGCIQNWSPKVNIALTYFMLWLAVAKCNCDNLGNCKVNERNT